MLGKSAVRVSDPTRVMPPNYAIPTKPVSWGDVPYPVRFTYDDFGRRLTMKTYRSGDHTVNKPTTGGDTTTWKYQPASGLLESKEDAALESVTYTYETGGKLDTRTWARNTVTDYDYDPKTGELESIGYSDTTPGITFTYDRMGRQDTVTDAVGTRTFDYNPTTLQLESETIIGADINEVITRTYDPGTDPGAVAGRMDGTTLSGDYEVDYGFDTVGRLNTVGWDVNGTQDAATYTYGAKKADGTRIGDLLAGMSTGTGQNTTYTYEQNRNLKTGVTNGFNGSTVSKYDYGYDTIGRRSYVKNSGSAFSQAAYNKYSYNNRNELTESKRHNGAPTGAPPVSPTTQSEVGAEFRSYGYDPIGNRTAVTEGSDVHTYAAANELNQYSDVLTAARVEDLLV